MKVETDRNWYDERVEAFVDGDLSRADDIRFRERLSSSKELQQDVEQARFLAAVLRSSPVESCPPEISQRVLAIARRDAGAEERVDRGPLRLVTKRRTWRSLTIVAAAACFAVLFLVRTGVNDSESFSQAEIDQALNDAKFALALVSDASRDAGRLIRLDAVPPVSHAMGLVLTDERSDGFEVPGSAADPLNE
ncbi:MAG: hypothetical protein HKN13_06250 [Rhodothermales bacterium]|nr:hypothetical protein [Rhodothermales bacterium]